MSLSVYFSFSDCSSFRRLDDDDEREKNYLATCWGAVMTECRDFSMKFSLPFLGRRSGVARVHAGTANNHFGLQLFFCQPSPSVSTPISIFKTRKSFFCAAHCGFNPRIDVHPKKITRRSLRLSVLWFSKAAAKKKETKAEHVVRVMNKWKLNIKGPRLDSIYMRLFRAHSL